MKIIHGREKIEDSLAIALGNFDGLHLGHRTLINDCLENARKKGLKPAVLTFFPHPRIFFSGDEAAKKILPFNFKDRMLEKMGIEYLIVLPFNKQVSTMDPVYFVEEILLKELSVKHISVGYNYRFGDKAKGDTKLLEKLEEKDKFSLSVVKEVKKDHRVISSTNVRKYLEKGKVFEAYELLGYCFTLFGKVVSGNNIGSEMGFPTANIEIAENMVMPKNGVYVGKCNLKGNIYDCLINIGVKPTVSRTGEKSIEVHIMDFDKDIYGENLEVAFIDYLRDEKHFGGIAELVAQLNKDMDNGKEILRNLHNELVFLWDIM